MERIEIAMNLIDERERLGYSRNNFAVQVGMTGESLRLYEMGKTNMSADFLAAAAQLGVDVQFVLTGIRSENLHLISQKFENQLNQQLNENKGVQFNAEVSGSPIVGNNNTVNQVTGTQNNITTQKHVTKTIAEVKPNETHINEKQRSILLDLVNQIVKKEEIVRRTPKKHNGVWSALNKFCGVPKYNLIALEDFEKAETYLRKWLGRLNSTATAKKDNPTATRTRQISYIKVNAAKFGLDDWIRAYVKKHFGVESIADLDEIELDKTYKAVAAKKRSKK